MEDVGRFYDGNKEHWSVDFAGVAAGFFSTSLGRLSGFEAEGMKTGIEVVENFLRYVLQHDVCPEYEADVKRALQICDDAREEFPMLLRLGEVLPGEFNLAAAEVFGIHEERDWAFDASCKMDRPDPRMVCMSYLAMLPEGPDWFNRVVNNKHEVVNKYQCTVEIQRILHPRNESRKVVKTASMDLTALIGRVVVKPATIEDDWEHPSVPRPFSKGTMELIFDEPILDNMKPGMKMTIVVCEVNVGYRFVKSLENIVPTFYTFLPQEMMRHYRQSRENTRPAPSIHDREGDSQDFESQDEPGENTIGASGLDD